MPMHFARFRYLNGIGKKVENVSFQGPLQVQVDDHPMIVVPPGEIVEIPEGAVVEVIYEEEVK